MRFALLPFGALLMAVLLTPLVLWLILPGDPDFLPLFAAAAVTGLVVLACLALVPPPPDQGSQLPRGMFPPRRDYPREEESRARILREQVARAEAEAARDQAREAGRRKDVLLTMLAQELGKSLLLIGKALDIVRPLNPTDPNLQGACDEIDRQVRKLTRLVDDLRLEVISKPGEPGV